MARHGFGYWYVISQTVILTGSSLINYLVTVIVFVDDTCAPFRCIFGLSFERKIYSLIHRCHILEIVPNSQTFFPRFTYPSTEGSSRGPITSSWKLGSSSPPIGSVLRVLFIKHSYENFQDGRSPRQQPRSARNESHVVIESSISRFSKTFHIALERLLSRELLSSRHLTSFCRRSRANPLRSLNMKIDMRYPLEGMVFLTGPPP